MPQELALNILFSSTVDIVLFEKMLQAYNLKTDIPILMKNMEKLKFDLKENDKYLKQFSELDDADNLGIKLLLKDFNSTNDDFKYLFNFDEKGNCYYQPHSSKILQIIKGNDIPSDKSALGVNHGLVLSSTNFYYTSGGQIGDVGTVTKHTSDSADVIDVSRIGNQTIHWSSVRNGNFKEGDEVICEIDNKRRFKSSVNHTACHLMTEAFQNIIGKFKPLYFVLQF